MGDIKDSKYLTHKHAYTGLSKYYPTGGEETKLSMHFKLVDPNYGMVFHAFNIQKLNSDSRININRNPESN